MIDGQDVNAGSLSWSFPRVKLDETFKNAAVLRQNTRFGNIQDSGPTHKPVNAHSREP